MAIVDAHGRLFGRVSILDLGAVLIIVFVLLGIFVAPGGKGSVATIGSSKPVEVDLVFRTVTASQPEELLQTLQAEDATNIIVRNQPSGTVELLNVEATPRSVAVPQPDGSVISLPDPRPELAYSIDLLVTVGGNAQVTETGPVLGGTKLKIGATVELEGMTYTMTGKVADVRILSE